MNLTNERQNKRGQYNSRVNECYWLLARKVEYVGHMDSTIAGPMNAGS